jgi:hypothetical protein
VQSLRSSLASLLLLTSVAGCSGSPPVPTADTSCERFRMIVATPKQADYLEADYDLMESYIDQMVAHNIEYAKHCLKEEKK